MAKICNNCGAQIADDSQFCTLCGAKTADICKQCGKELKEGAKFCVGCGTLVEEPLPEAASTCPDAIICRQCGKELKEGAKFCVECGTLVEEPSPKSANSCANANVCRQCGKELKEGARFCVGCGAMVEEPLPEGSSTCPDANICRQCGKELKEGAKFCVECGAMVEESSQGIITASENDQVSAPPDRPQQIIESVTDEITKPYNDFIDQAEAPSLASSQNIAETVLPPINPPLSPAAASPEAKKRFFSKKIYLGILGALAVACVFIYINVGIFVIPPSMITGGLSVVYWRNDTKNPFISSPEIMISEDNFYTKVALLKKISDREITRFKYNDWLYSKALKGIEFAGPSSPSAQATEPTEEPVALADEEETSDEELPEEIPDATKDSGSQTLAAQTSPGEGQIRGTNVNMREFPSLTSQVIYKFPGWEYVTIHEVRNPEQGKYPWFKVSYKNMTGWVYGEFVNR